MKSFKGYINESILLNEADTEAAKDMEAVIVSAAGGPEFISKLIPDSAEVGDKIVTSGDTINVTYTASA